jgi:hypothetical protein
MKKFFNKVQNKANELAIRAKTTLDNAKAEGYIDTGVKIIIGVVVGAVILGGLYALFDNVILPTLETKINGMFNYTA